MPKTYIIPTSQLRSVQTGYQTRLGQLSRARSVCTRSAPKLLQDSVVDRFVVETYSGSASLWSLQELSRLIDVRPNTKGQLVLERGTWEWAVRSETQFVLYGRLKFHNTNGRLERFISKVSPRLEVLSEDSTDWIKSAIKILPKHENGNGYPPADKRPRKDGYWSGYVLKANSWTEMEVIVDVTSDQGQTLDSLIALSLELQYTCYGAHGVNHCVQHVILPTCFPAAPAQPDWRPTQHGAHTLAVRTHLLCHLDDPVSVVRRYVLPHYARGDILVIAESPLAIMQGRFRHPQNIQISTLARTACLLFTPTSSLATACGMQVLMDLVGPVRVLAALVVGILGRLVGIRGLFYWCAGEQATLIDDITGTLPPYDQFLVLGPERVQQTVDAIYHATGVPTAVVDASDLSRKSGLRILGHSAGVDKRLVVEVIKYNPAGNADQRTPLVLIRPG